MGFSSNLADNVAINAQGRFALYIEGVYCAFTSAQLLVEDGMIPRLSITVPATPELRDLSRRARVHILHKEVVMDEWVVMLEAEILTRGFNKTPTSRDLTFMAYHVAGHLDQYAITSLDPAAANLAAMNGKDVSEPMTGMGAFNG